MKNFFSLLSRREKGVVLTGSGLLVVFLVYLLIGRPLGQRLDAYEQEIPARRELLAWMEQAAQEVKRAQAIRQSPPGERSGTGSNLSLINKTAKELQLDKAIKRVEPTEEQGVRVWLDEVSFDGMIPWLALLREREGLTVTDISVERGKAPGGVNALITFGGGQP